jgi:tryptophanyl-tRNA synthetase
MSKKRLVSGIQPTGRMHIGNFLGAIQNWVSLQDDYDSFFMIADLHALTSVYENPSQLRVAKRELAIDILAAGVDPEKACLFYQSDVREHAELHLYLSMVTPLPWLERVPTYKGKIDELKGKNLQTYGFLGYPVLQAADILLYQGNVVPVGKDQLPHLELAREIVRRFNHLYKTHFPEADERLTNFPVLPGLDGRKMSKSYKNTIPISSSPEEITALILKMTTDPQRVRRDDPGNPEVCSVFSYHSVFNTETKRKDIDTHCRQGTIGCVECKKQCAALIGESLASFRERRSYFETHPEDVDSALENGAKKASVVANETMKEIKKAIGL